MSWLSISRSKNREEQGKKRRRDWYGVRQMVSAKCPLGITSLVGLVQWETQRVPFPPDSGLLTTIIHVIGGLCLTSELRAGAKELLWLIWDHGDHRSSAELEPSSLLHDETRDSLWEGLSPKLKAAVNWPPVSSYELNLINLGLGEKKKTEPITYRPITSCIKKIHNALPKQI